MPHQFEVLEKYKTSQIQLTFQNICFHFMQCRTSPWMTKQLGLHHWQRPWLELTTSTWHWSGGVKTWSTGVTSRSGPDITKVRPALTASYGEVVRHLLSQQLRINYACDSDELLMDGYTITQSVAYSLNTQILRHAEAELIIITIGQEVNILSMSNYLGK